MGLLILFVLLIALFGGLAVFVAKAFLAVVLVLVIVGALGGFLARGRLAR